MPKSLDMRTASIDVQDALVHAVELAYLRRYPEAADVAALSAVENENLPDRALVYVVAEGVVYQLRKGNTSPVMPPDIVATLSSNGRWVRQSSSLTLGLDFRKPLHRIRQGSVKAVEAFQGDMDEFLQRLFAQRPAYGIELIEDDYQLRAQRQGSIYDCKWKLILHSTAFNLRHGTDALYGSEVEQDSGINSERGIYRLMGDLRYLLAGSNLGLGLSIKFASIDGNGRLVENDLGQRYFRAEIDLTVHGTVQRLDEDLQSPFSVHIERYDTSGPGVFDPANFVAQGCKIETQTGLSASPAPGVAYIDGQAVVPSTGLHAFAPNRDTWRDLLPTGQWVYQDVEQGMIAPAVANALRVGYTRTDASNIIGDVLTCHYRLTTAPVTGDPFEVKA